MYTAIKKYFFSPQTINFSLVRYIILELKQIMYISKLESLQEPTTTTTKILKYFVVFHCTFYILHYTLPFLCHTELDSVSIKISAEGTHKL